MTQEKAGATGDEGPGNFIGELIDEEIAAGRQHVVRGLVSVARFEDLGIVWYLGHQLSPDLRNAWRQAMIDVGLIELVSPWLGSDGFDGDAIARQELMDAVEAQFGRCGRPTPRVAAADLHPAMLAAESTTANGSQPRVSRKSKGGSDTL